MSREVNPRKAAVIGCGFVGSATAFTLMQSKLFSELVLIDVDKARAEGEAMDISHGMPFAAPMKIYAGSYDDIVDADIIIITAGANQKPGETRLELVKKNVAIYKNIIPEIANRRCRFWRDSADRIESGGYTDAGSIEIIRFSGKPGNRFRNCIGYGPVKKYAGKTAWHRQSWCACIYCRRTRRQRGGGIQFCQRIRYSVGTDL